MPTVSMTVDHFEMVPSGGVVVNVDREGCARPRRKAALSSVQLQVNPGRTISNANCCGFAMMDFLIFDL